jgi:hypothetical protein
MMIWRAMQPQTCNPSTPWQKVFARFGLSAAELARELGRHRSKLSVVLADTEGLINSRDAVALYEAAKRLNVKLVWTDFVSNG